MLQASAARTELHLGRWTALTIWQGPCHMEASCVTAEPPRSCASKMCSPGRSTLGDHPRCRHKPLLRFSCVYLGCSSLPHTCVGDVCCCSLYSSMTPRCVSKCCCAVPAHRDAPAETQRGGPLFPCSRRQSEQRGCEGGTQRNSKHHVTCIASLKPEHSWFGMLPMPPHQA